MKFNRRRQSQTASISDSPDPDFRWKLSSRPLRIAAEIAFRGSAASLAFFALFGFNTQALAATDTWTGADTAGTPTSDWINGDNWVAGTVPVSGDSLVFGSTNAQTSGTLTDSLTSSTFLINGITFSLLSPAYTFTGNAFELGGTILNNGTNTQTINNAIVLGGSESLLTNPYGGNLSILGGIGNTGGNFGITIAGGGIVKIGGINASTYTGATTINAGTLQLDFTASGAPASNIISGGVTPSSLGMNGGALQILGAATGSTQTFAKTTISAGGNVITVGTAALAVAPTVNLGTLAGNTSGLVEFVGPAYNSAASSGTTLGANTIAATGTFTATSQTGAGGIIISNTGAADSQAYATVGLYDWAAISTGAGGTAQTGTIVGASQIPGFYTVEGALAANTFGLDVDLTASATMSGNSTTLGSEYSTIRFNTLGAITLTTGRATSDNSVGAILITPNVGVNNTIFAGTLAFQPSRDSGGGATSFTVWQNDTAGEFIISAPYTNAKSGASAYTQGGPGTVVLSSAASSYTGVNNLDGGTTVISADIGLGAVATGAGVNLDGGTLFGNATFNLDNAGANDRPITLLGAGGAVAAAAGATFTVDGVIGSGSGVGALVIGIPAYSANNNTVGLVPGTGASTANATGLLANGIVSLTGANFYYGGTVLDSGTLRINGINALGGADYGGFTFNGGTLQYAAGFSGNGSGDLTSIGTGGVLINAGGATIDLNGNSVTYGTGIGRRGTGSLNLISTTPGGTLTLAGNNTFSGSITLTSANLIMNGSNLNTGTTAVSGGNLTLTSGASMGDTSVVVSNGKIFTAAPGSGNIQIGTTGGALTLNAGTTLTMADGNTGTLTFNQPGAGTGTVLSLLGTSANPDLFTFDVGGTGTGADELIANNGTAVITGSGGTLITLSAFGTTAPTSLTNIPLLSVPNGALVLQDFTLQSNLITSWSSGAYSAALTLNGAGNTLLLTLTPQVSNLNYFWTGANDNTWTTVGNFATDATGTQAQTTPLTNSDNVFETATSSQNNSQLLNGSYALNAIGFTGSNAVALRSGTISLNALNTFTDTSNGNQYAAGIGLVVEAGVPADTIAAAVNLQRNQIWEIDSAANAPLTVSGVIGNGVGSDSLTKTGSGTLILAGSNTYSGGTTISVGTIALGANNALPGTGTLTISGTGATFDLAGFNQTLNGLSDGGVSTGTITASTGNSVLTVSGTAPTIFSGFVTDSAGSNGASLALVYTGSSTLTLSSSNHYTGSTTVSNGTLVASSNYSLGNPLSTSGGLVMNPATGGTATTDFTSSSPKIASLASSGAGTSLLVLGNSSGLGSPTTLTIGLAQNSTVFNGTITDNKSVIAAALGSINLVGGSLTLGGSDSYFGSTTLTAGNLILANSFALQDSSLVINTGAGTLSFGSLTAATIGGLSGNASISLANNTNGAVALTVSGNAVANTGTYGGSFSGPGSVTITTGNLTLTGASSYTGVTTLNAGTTTFAAGSSLGLSNTAGAITENGGTLNIAGAFINTSSFTTNTGGIINVSANGTLDIVGALSMNASNGNTSGLLAITSGTVNAASVTIGRGSLILTGTQTTGSTTNDIYVNGGALNVATTFDIGSGNTKDTSSSSVRIDSGVINVGGITNIANDAGGRYSLLDVNGGVFNENDPSGTGILLGGNANTGLSAELLVSGSGVLNTPGIVLGNAADNGGLFVFEDIGGTVNLGAGGISSSLPTNIGTTSVNLGLASVATAPILTATANWSSALAMNLNNSSTGIAPTFNTLPGDTITLSGNLSSTGTGGIIVSGSGLVALSGNNTYNGVTTITSGTLSLQSATASGSTSAITFSGSGGKLQYSANNTTDFSPIFANSTARISIDTNGQAVTYASTFQTSNTGGFSVGDSSGGGSLTLTAPNTYTGPTTVRTNGKLILASGASLGDTAISVNSGAVLQTLPGTGNLQIGTTAASLTLNAGGGFSMADNNVGTVTLNQVGVGTASLLNLNGTTATPDSLTFDIGAAGVDQLIVNNGVVTFAAATPQTNIILDSILGAAPASLTNIPILQVPNGLLVLGDFTLQTPNISLGGSSYSASLTVGGSAGNTELFLNLTQGSTTNAYFTGQITPSWSNISNFATTAAGTVVQTGSLNSVTNVFLNANNATGVTSETLDGDYAINSLSFTSSATQSITLASGTADALTLIGGNGFTDSAGNAYAATTGLVVQPGSASHTISANIDLGASQSWAINNAPANGLIVTGTIADAPATTLDSLTKTGTGTLILENAETYDGGTTVNQGTLMLGAGGSLLASGTLTVTGTGTFDLGSNNQTVARLSSGGVSTGIVTASTGADTLTVTNNTTNTIRQFLTDASATNSAASLALVLAGTSTVTISNSNSFVGGVTISAGNLAVSNDYGLGNPTSSNLNAGLNFTNAGTSTVSFTSATPHIASLSGNNLGSGAVDSIVLGTIAGSGSSTTLFIGAGGNALFGAAGTTYNGTISDLSSQASTAVGNLVINGGGFVVLGGVDTFTGTTIVSGSASLDGGVTYLPSTLQLANSLALENSTLNYNNQGGVINFGSLSTVTLGGLTGSENLALTTPSATAVTLTIGNNNVSSLYTGNLSGGGALTKAGSGTFQVGSGTTGGASFSGGLAVNNGTIILGGVGTISGAVNIGAANGNSNIIVQDSASISSPSQLGFDVGSNATPFAATLTMNSSGTVAVAGITFGNGTDRAAIGDALTINSGSVLDSGSFNFMNTVGGTGNEGFVTVNLNGGLLGVNNFLLTNFGGNALSGAVFNFNGGTLEALASDPSGSTFLPAISRLTVNVGVAGAIINTNGFNDTITQALLSGTTGDGGLTKLGSGILTLAGSNTYTGATRINGGELTLGSSNAINASTAITFGGGALRYTSANTADLSSRFANSTGTVAIDVNGQAITFATPIAATNTGGLSVQNSVANTGGLTLTTAQSYTGQTLINSGATLTLASGASLPNPNVVDNGTLVAQVGNGGINAGTGTFVIGGGGALSLVDGQIGALTINGGITIGGATAGALDFDFNTSTGSTDLLTVTGGVTYGTGGGVINLTDLSTASTPSVLQYQLIGAASGLGSAKLTLGQSSILINGQTFSLSLANSSGSQELLTLTQIVSNYYWTGVSSASWSTIGNFAHSPVGSPAWTGSLGTSANVFETANSATRVTETLDNNYTINSLSFTGTGTTAATTPITLGNGSASALTISAAAAFGDQNNNAYSAGTGLVVQPGSASHIINANINLGNSQTWNVNNSPSSPLTINGVIGDGSTADSLTKTGTGTLLINTAETYDGGTIINQGTLQIGANNVLLTTGNLTVSGSGTFNLGGKIQTLGALSDGGNSTGVITTTTGSSTLILNNAGNVSYAGAINDTNSANGAALALNLIGTGNVTLSGSSNFSGGTNFNGSGNLIVANNYALGNPGATGANAGLTLSALSGGTGSVFFTSANPTIAALNYTGFGGVNGGGVVLGGTAGAGSATTLSIGAGNLGISTFNGTISDLTATSSGAIGSVNITGGAVVTFTGTNTYTGTTTITGTATQLVLSDSNTIENSIYNTSGGGTLQTGTFTNLMLGGLTGTNGFALASGTNPLNVTVGDANVSSTFNGNLTGASQLTKTGTGSITLNDATYTNSTTLVQSGTITYGGASNVVTHLDIAAQTGTSGVVINGATVTSTGGLYITSPTGGPATAFGRSANLTATNGAQLTALADSSGRAISYGNGTITKNGRPSVLGVFTVGTIGDTTTLVMAEGALDVYDSIGGGTAGNFAVNLNGGTLAVDNILKTTGGTTQTSTINFNGGTLMALASDPTGSTFLPQLSGLTTNVMSGGAVINTNGFNITIVQPLVSGTTTDGGLTKNGLGNLTLAGTNTYLGATTVNAGRLIVSGSVGTGLLTTTAVNINSGGTLEDDSVVNNAITTVVSGRLSGNGSVGAISVLTSGTLAPGFNSTTTAAGTLTAHGNVNFGTNDKFSIRLGVATPTDNDQLLVTNGNVSLHDATLALNDGAAFNPAVTGLNFIYILVNGGAASTGSGIDVFGNALTSGATVTDADGDVFGIFYGVNGTNSGSGSDVVAELETAAVPEPGTWASLLGGLAVMLVWHRRSRRRSA